MKTRVNVLAILVAAIVHFGLGAAWFTAFAKPWIAGLGMSPEKVRAATEHPSPLPYFIAFLCNLVMAYAIAWVLARSAQRGIMRGIGTGLVLGLLAAAAMATEQSFEMRPAVFRVISAGYPLLGCIIMGAIIGAWKQKAAEPLSAGTTA